MRTTTKWVPRRCRAWLARRNGVPDGQPAVGPPPLGGGQRAVADVHREARDHRAGRAHVGGLISAAAKGAHPMLSDLLARLPRATPIGAGSSTTRTTTCSWAPAKASPRPKRARRLPRRWATQRAGGYAALQPPGLLLRLPTNSGVPRRGLHMSRAPSRSDRKSQSFLNSG